VFAYVGDVIMQGDTTTDIIDSSLDSASTSSTSLRLLLHLKDNQIQYMIGVLVAYQVGLLDKIYTYGAGVC
jgi:hypothetical protein